MSSTAPISNLVDPIMQIMQVAFDPAYREAWNRRQIGDALALPNTHAIVVDEGGATWTINSAQEPAAFVLTRSAVDEEELLLIAVAPAHRRQGLGKALIEQLAVDAKDRGAARIFLEMRRGNPAISLYEKTGFMPIGTRPNYYRLVSGERVDAITFAKVI